MLLGTVNDLISVSAPMELYQVADKIWQKCFELSVMTSEMAWHEIKRATCRYSPEPMETCSNIHTNNLETVFELLYTMIIIFEVYR